MIFAFRFGLLSLLFIAAFPAHAADAVIRALSYANTLQAQATDSVALAEQRLVTAQSDVRLTRAVEAEVRHAKDPAATQVVEQAVAESLAHEREAKYFLNEARAILIKRSQSVAALQDLQQRNSTRGVGVRYDGTVVPLGRGSMVKNGKGETAHLFVAGGEGEVMVGENSTYRVTNDDIPLGFSGQLESGFARIRGLVMSFSSRFEVRTPAAVCAVRGTDFSVTTDAKGERVQVFEGVVAVTPLSGGDPVMVSAGNQLDISPQGSWPAPTAFDAQAIINPWSTERDTSSH